MTVGAARVKPIFFPRAYRYVVLYPRRFKDTHAYKQYNMYAPTYSIIECYRRGVGDLILFISMLLV
jgi:hypothetical protein